MSIRYLDTLPKHPDYFTSRGFECFEEETTDPDRVVIFRKHMKLSGRKVYLDLCLRYQVYISDIPSIRTSDNFDYEFMAIYLPVVQRDGDPEPRELGGSGEIGRWVIDPQRYSDVRTLTRLLVSGSAEDNLWEEYEDEDDEEDDEDL